MCFKFTSHRFYFPLLCALLVLWCCGSGDVTFSPDQDAQALTRILQTWEGTLGELPFSMTLCEDVEANATFVVDGCTYAHLVRSADSTAERSVERANGGCENCFLGVLTNVRATLTQADGEILQVNGLVSLGTTFDEDPYEGDYGLLLYADESLVMEGRLQPDGKLILSGAQLLNLGFDVSEAEVEFEKGETASCGSDHEDS